MKLLTIIILTAITTVVALQDSRPEQAESFNVICCESPALTCKTFAGVPACPSGWTEVTCPCPID